MFFYELIEKERRFIHRVSSEAVIPEYVAETLSASFEFEQCAFPSDDVDIKILPFSDVEAFLRRHKELCFSDAVLHLGRKARKYYNNGVTLYVYLELPIAFEVNEKDIILYGVVGSACHSG